MENESAEEQPYGVVSFPPHSDRQPDCIIEYFDDRIVLRYRRLSLYAFLLVSIPALILLFVCAGFPSILIAKVNFIVLPLQQRIAIIGIGVFWVTIGVCFLWLMLRFWSQSMFSREVTVTQNQIVSKWGPIKGKPHELNIVQYLFIVANSYILVGGPGRYLQYLDFSAGIGFGHDANNRFPEYGVHMLAEYQAVDIRGEHGLVVINQLSILLDRISELTGIPVDPTERVYWYESRRGPAEYWWD